ncbi:5-oxoprolinase isoform X2 [Cimex lectularius]|uniref:5-oxoprolinase n=1 Tax=Cimex lectularius TaxID=79782 RepID=A0A8I6TB43_CIMLE|nr:5-oxoprolinase isoform X2 [Cimex lectularius]
MNGKFRFAIDRGGTFTDVYAQCPNGDVKTLKLLSVDPANYEDAPREGIRRIIEEITGKNISKSEKISCDNIEWIRMGTTVATNALLERKGEKMALVITKGFRDLLYIGNQARPKIFDLKILMPEVLYEEVVEVNCRIVPEMKERCLLPDAKAWDLVKSVSGERYLIKQHLNETEVTTDLKKLLDKGIKSIAVVLMHSYMWHDHELQIGKIAENLGFTNISLSHQVMPMVKIVNRGYTACADAYLTPHIKKYVKSFASGFKDDLKNVNVLFMQSDGGLTPMTLFNGSRAVLSGPAGGVVGYAQTTPGSKPIIGFDMGGTSTDVSRFAGEYEHIFESTVAGVTLQAPQLDINTVAAGGGSRLFFRSGLFVVGPESAGAHPGPVCYRKGGYLTVTDANLVLGRLLPEYFPKIFGPDEKEPIDKEAALEQFEQLKEEINSFLSSEGEKNKLSVEEVAMGFIKVANESMCRPIRALTQGKGFDTRDHVLTCFGGAGGQHACAIARDLGITEVFMHKYAGILSAYGIAYADVVHEEQKPSTYILKKNSYPAIVEQLKKLENQCVKELKVQGFLPDNIQCQHFLNLRYEGTDGSLMCSSKNNNWSDNMESFETTFLTRYKAEFGFVIPDRNILVDDIRVRGVGLSKPRKESVMKPSKGKCIPENVVKVYFETFGYLNTDVFTLQFLIYGHKIKGPALIMDELSTILIEPHCEATITETGDIIVKIEKLGKKKVGQELNAIQLSIFSHRFMSIAEQMGRVLQRTAISTNIKERLDFSCALFGPDGGLVSNAPHIPVHLGSMQDTVQFQLKLLGNSLKEGDVILSNHPKAGGSHLPDLTVITPVFYKNVKRPVFFVACRGHHADIGGITPGSMPPHSKHILEEGASFKSFFLVRDGHFHVKELEEELMKPAKRPGSSGTRNLHDNIADLQAQIAANQKGIILVNELINAYGLDVVLSYMDYIQQNAELAVQDLLKTVGKRQLEQHGTTKLFSEDFLDDGSRICLTVNIDINKGTAVFDFTGSGYEVWGNCNAPKAISSSALIYCLRSMVGHDVPLNQGCLAPIKLILPKGSILDPSDDAAVVGGNVQTSQRIVDVILNAFKACAASQGCMNNVTFGQKSWGYYETIAGGAGAGPSWNGRSGVHTHMTNTRITDPEILENRYPIILEAFNLRENSGGNGAFRGGDGVNRILLFRNHISLSILTERRVFHPYGLEGGSPGAKGVNLMHRRDGRIIYLQSKTAIDVEPGDSFQILTPGGGGWGKPGSRGRAGVSSDEKNPCYAEKGSVFEYKQAQISA